MSTAPIPQPSHRWFAAVYDTISKADEKKMARIRTTVAGGAAGRVLEVGCGTGGNLPFYDWSKVDSLVATEPDPHMLKRAYAKLHPLDDATRAKVSLQQAPAEALPFPDASFDCVVATLVFCTVSDPALALSEAHRVLKPGGTLRLAEHVASTGFAAQVQHLIQPAYGWTSGGCQLSRHTEESVRAAGFTLEVTDRNSLGPLWPLFIGVATRG